jgi:hypothetical protein
VRFNDTIFEDTGVDLDGHSFVGCTFNRCRVMYSGGNFVDLKVNTFRDCFWEFKGPAAHTLQFLRALYHGCGGGRELVEQTMRQFGVPPEPT